MESKRADAPGAVAVAVLCLLAAVVCAAHGGSRPEWPEVTRDMRPWCYNWWMGSAVDAKGLEAQASALAAAGFGGYHVIPIYGAKGWEPRYRRLLSDSWMDAFGDAVRIGNAHGLGVDLTMGAGWCFGGPQLKKEEGCWRIFVTNDEVAVESDAKVLWRGVDSDGKRRILAVAPTGQQVKRAGLGGQGPMMDPYSSQAMDSLLKPFSAAFDKAGAARPEHFYHDSFEYFNAGWTPGFFDAFKAKRGYDLKRHLAELAGVGPTAAVARVKCDYRETLSDLIVEDVFPRWVAWCRARGVATRNEAHGGPVNWLDFYALCDIPETEMYSDSCRNVLVSKFASSAAHVTGRPVVSSESCTWLGQHFRETLADAKEVIDRLFLSGVNHMFYHGCCYSPVEARWPGWCFYAAMEMNPRNTIWRDVDALNAYITRCQSMFRSCEPDNDVLVYWPLRDLWMDADGFEKRLSVHNAPQWFGSQPVGHTAKALYEAGYSFDYVSDRQLMGLDLSRRRYTALVVPPCRHMPERTSARISRLESLGLKVYRNGDMPVSARREPFGAESGIEYVRYRKGAATVYFLVNGSNVPVRRAFRPAAGCGAVWEMDPLTGGIAEMPVEDGAVEVNLAAKHSTILYVEPGKPAAARRCAPRETCRPFAVNGPWTLEPVAGGPEPLPRSRTVATLSGWERNADGSENPFCGTMRYRTVFDAPSTNATVIDLGDVRQSARVVLNGRDLGKTFIAPFRLRVPAGTLRRERNVLEVEVTSVAANRVRKLDQDGVKWRIFHDVNFVSYPFHTNPFDASKWPLTVNGLLGPVILGDGLAAPVPQPATLSSSEGIEVGWDALTCLESGRNPQPVPWEGWTSVNYCNRQKIEPGRIVDGDAVLYIGGPTGKCDTAWRAASPRIAVPRGTTRCFLSFDVEAPVPLPETDGKVAGWNNLFFWYGADGAQKGMESMRYSTDKPGVSHVRTSSTVPEGVSYVSVQFGCDKPDVGVGESVVYRNLRISFAVGRPAYVEEGRYVSSIHEGGWISWDAETPYGTSVRFRVRGAKDAASLAETAFVGPDGTPETSYSEPFESPFPYVQYEAILRSAPDLTPALKAVHVGRSVDCRWIPRKDAIAPCVKIASESPTTNRAERLRLEVADETCVDWRSVKVSIDGRDATASFVREGRHLVQTGPAPSWKDGLHAVVAVAADMQGNVATNRLAFFVGPAPAVPAVTLRDDGMALVGGRPFFPIGAYGVCRREFNGMDLDVAFKGLKASGFNFAQTYDNAYDPDFLSAARRHGFLLWVSGRSLNRSFLEVGRNDPSILAWYIGDDTSANTKPEALRGYHESLKAVDPGRLTCHADVIYSDRTISNFAPYVTGADVFMPEIYPVLGFDGDPRDEICVAVTIRDMKAVHREMREFGDGRTRAVWPILQWFKGWLGWMHFPTREQLFATSFAALANGANGITWYTYGGFYDKKRKAYNEGMTSTPDRWRDMGELATWISELSPALLAYGAERPAAEILSGPAVNKLGGPTVTTLLKRHGGSAYLIAVNATTENVRARFRVPEVGAEAEVQRENRRVRCSGGVLEDDFAPIAVHVYSLMDLRNRP